MVIPICTRAYSLDLVLDEEEAARLIFVTAEQKIKDNMKIRLRVKRAIVTAKRSVLEANCGYFQTMFDGRFQPSQEVDLSCVAEDISTVKKILKYFDGKSLKCICRTLTSTLKVLKVAYFLQAHSLIKQCLAYMKRFICLDNAMGLYFDLKEMELNVPTLTDILKSRFHDYYIRQEATNKLTSTQVKQAINDGLFQFCSAGSLLGFIHHYLVTDLTTDRVKVCHELLTCFNFEKSLKHTILSAELILDIENICSNIEALVLPSDLVQGDVDDFISVLKKLLVDVKEIDDKWMDKYLRAVVCVVPDIRGECDSIEEAHIYLYIPSSGVWYKFDKPLSNEKPEKDDDYSDEDDEEEDDEEEEDQLEEPALEEFLGNSGKFWLSRCNVSKNSLIASMDSDIAFFRIALPDMCVTKVVKNPYKNHDVCKGIMISPVIIHYDDILLVTKLYHESDDLDEVAEVSLSEGGIFVDDLEEYNRNSVNKAPLGLTDGPGAFLVTEFLWGDGNKFIVFEVDYLYDCCIHFIAEAPNILDMLRLPEIVTSFDMINLEFQGVPTLLCPEKSDRYAILEVGEKTWVTATMEYHSCKMKNTEYKYDQIESIKSITDVDLRPRAMNIKKLATHCGDSLWVFQGGDTETGISSLKQHRVTGAMEAEEIVHTPPPFHFCSAMFVNEWRMSSFHKFLKLATFGIH